MLEPATVCPVCGLNYVPRFREDQYHHAQAHYEATRALWPQPRKRYLRSLKAGALAVEVGPGSARWKNEEMHARAKRFKREMKYDFIAWDMAPAPGTFGFLFNDDTGTFGRGSIVGACSMMLLPEENGGRWEMVWVWVAPDARRKGVLARQWPALRERFGAFDLQEPLSPAMERFAQAHHRQA